MMQRISYLVLGLLFLPTVNGSYKAQVEELPLLKNKLFLQVYSEGGKTQPMVLSANEANLSFWLRAHASAHAGSDKKPLTIPVDEHSMKRIRTGMKAINEGELDDLQYEVFDIQLPQFADLLIYCWLLKIERLLNVAGPEFVDRFKRNYLNDFLVRADYLSTVFRTQGKPGNENWDQVIKDLKEWLAGFILADNDTNEIRSSLSTIIDKNAAFAQATIIGDQLLLSGAGADDGYCSLFEVDSHELTPLITGAPVQSCSFGLAPFIVLFNANECALLDLIKKKTIYRIAAREHSERDQFSAMAQSADLRKIALALQNKLLLVETKYKKIEVLDKLTLQGKDIILLRFVPLSPVLVVVRSGGTLQFWNSETSNLMFSSDEHKAEIKKVHCVKDGTVFTMSGNGVLIKWDCSKIDKNGKFANNQPTFKKWDPGVNTPGQNDALWFPDTYVLCFNDKGTRVVLAGDQGKHLFVHNVEDNTKVVLENEAKEVGIDGCFGRDDLLAVLTPHNGAIIWDPLKGNKLTTIANAKKEGPFFFSSDGEYLVSSRLSDGKLGLWFYGSKKIQEYLKSKLTLEQALLLLIWLDPENQHSIPDYEHLNVIARTMDKQLLGKFL